MELKLEVSHCTTNLEEDGTEVRHQEEATSNQPVPEGTEISLQRINSTHYNQYNTSLKHGSLTVRVRGHMLNQTNETPGRAGRVKNIQKINSYFDSQVLFYEVNKSSALLTQPCGCQYEASTT